ncbi:MAG: LysM peptidoglycan-binding domain-containing protein [Candidatus Eremiobacteraeota bacterium]|nr:LysM peptidoglycan-binding domain-containing protein [Candidatus Eremiobacteraeota bacterium]
MYSRRQKRFTLMPAIALAALGALVAVPALSSSRLYAAGPEHFATVTVHQGDTLWTLAERRTPSGANVQDTVDSILAVNHLESAAVVPGQHLKIPR